MTQSWTRPFITATTLAAALAGCTATPQDLLAAQRREIARADQAGAAAFPEGQFYLRSAHTELGEAERLFRMGLREQAEARLGNAQADARLACSMAEANVPQATAALASPAHTSIPAASLFRGASTDLSPGGEALLNHLARRLLSQQDRTIGLHTYAEEDAGLAHAQAARIKDYLVKRGLRARQLHSESASLAPRAARLEVTLHPAP